MVDGSSGVSATTPSGTGAEVTTTGSVESTSSSATGFAEDDVETCKWNHESRPEVFAEVEIASGEMARAEAGPDGDFYLVGQEWDSLASANEDVDVLVWKLSATGEVLWSAQWGNIYGWDDEAFDVLVTSDAVLVSGAAAVLRDEEYTSNGHAFVRAYTHGGVVKWTWEDEGGPSASKTNRNPRVLAALDDQVLVAAVIDDWPADDYLRVVTLSAEGEEVDAWTYDRSGELLAVHADPNGEVLVALSDTPFQPWVGRWSGDGAFLDPEIWQQELGRVKAAEFFGEGLVTVGSTTGDRLTVARFDTILGFPQEKKYRSGDDGAAWSFFLDVAVDCTGAAWVTTMSESFPLSAYDENAERLWKMDGLSTVAVNDDGVAITAGYDDAKETTVVRWLRAAE